MRCQLPVSTRIFESLFVLGVNHEENSNTATHDRCITDTTASPSDQNVMGLSMQYDGG